MDNRFNHTFWNSNRATRRAARVHSLIREQKTLGGWLRSRLSGPGGLYNIGNVLALFSGIVVQIVAVWGQTSIVAAVRDHLAGSAGALWLTIAMLTFILSGEFYHRAWRVPSKPDMRSNQLGDLTSGLAAIALTLALVEFGDTTLAICAGVLLAGGKLGSGLITNLNIGWKAPIKEALGAAVILSRLPSLAALGLTLIPLLGAPQLGLDVVLPAVMFLCFLLWLGADFLLLRKVRSLAP